MAAKYKIGQESAWLTLEFEKCIKSNNVACWEFQVKTLLKFDYRIPEAVVAVINELENQPKEVPITITPAILDKLKGVDVIDRDFTVTLVGTYYIRGDAFLAAWNARSIMLCEDMLAHMTFDSAKLPKLRKER